jgi:hypothetical protein
MRMALSLGGLSMMTHLRTRISLAFLLAAAVPAQAGQAIQAAQAERSKAYNDFFEMYRVDKKKSPESIAAIRSATIGKSNQTTSNAIQQEAYDSIKQMGVMVMTEKEVDQFRKREAARLASDKSGEKSGGGATGGDVKSGSRGGSSIHFGGASEQGPAKAEEKIDGSKIPRKIEFHKKKPKKDEDDE